MSETTTGTDSTGTDSTVEIWVPEAGEKLVFCDEKAADWHALTGEPTFSTVEPLTANEQALARQAGRRL